jgi:hypothetical protein
MVLSKSMSVKNTIIKITLVVIASISIFSGTLSTTVNASNACPNGTYAFCTDYNQSQYTLDCAYGYASDAYCTNKYTSVNNLDCEYGYSKCATGTAPIYNYNSNYDYTGTGLCYDQCPLAVYSRSCSELLSYYQGVSTKTRNTILNTPDKTNCNNPETVCSGSTINSYTLLRGQICGQYNSTGFSDTTTGTYSVDGYYTFPAGDNYLLDNTTYQSYQYNSYSDLSYQYSFNPTSIFGEYPSF